VDYSAALFLVRAVSIYLLRFRSTVSNLISVSKIEPPGPVSVNVIVPVGLDPPERVALSLSVTRDAERVTLGLVAVVRVGVGGGASVSVAVLLARLGSIVPAGGVTVTVLVNKPVADGLTWATAVKVAVPPGRSVTALRMLPVPVPVAWATLDPAEATAVQQGRAISGAGIWRDGAISVVASVPCRDDPFLARGLSQPEQAAKAGAKARSHPVG
jgi:hypothetical protein